MLLPDQMQQGNPDRMPAKPFLPELHIYIIAIERLDGEEAEDRLADVRARLADVSGHFDASRRDLHLASIGSCSVKVSRNTSFVAYTWTDISRARQRPSLLKMQRP